MTADPAAAGRIPFPARVVSPPSAGPLAPAERIHALDILRGLALFGMVVVHFHQRVNTETEGIEGLIGWVVWVGLETKSWGTFAFLFGVGFAVLLRRMEARGQRFVAFYLRRMALLAGFGLAVEVLFGFRVLFEYALWGTPLLLLRRLSTPWLLGLAALSAAIRPVLRIGAAAGLLPPLTSPERTAAGAALRAAVEEAGRGDSFSALMSARLDLLLHDHAGPTTFVPGVTLTLFILGLLAVRAGVVDEPRRHARLIASWMLFGFISWAGYWLVLYHLPEEGVVGGLRSGFGIVNEQWLTFTFAGGILLLLAYLPLWRSRLAWAGWSGRMALTNYVLQAAVLDFVVSGYGLSLRLRPALGLVAAGVLFGLEALVSRFWLARHRFGPLEWVWRSLSYGTPQKIGREATTAPPPVGE